MASRVAYVFPACPVIDYEKLLSRLLKEESRLTAEEFSVVYSCFGWRFLTPRQTDGVLAIARRLGIDPSAPEK